MRTPKTCLFLRLAGKTLALLVVEVGLLSVSAVYSHAQIRITLNNTFIEKFKNRVTIDTTFTVDDALNAPHPVKEDADLHVAGRAPEIGLATVAEIMNAASEPDALTLIKQIKGTSQTVKLSGAWRIWCEHGGKTTHTQGAPLSPFSTSNPDHIFEVHPITSLNGTSLLQDLHPIDPGFQTKDAATAFTTYENVRCRLVPSGQTTMIETSMAGFNYVEFKMQLLEDPTHVVPDGITVFADVLDLSDELLVRKRRMVFVKGSEPEKQLEMLKKGATMHVLGIPRMDLSEVSWRLKQADKSVLNWNLPYEIIVVGIYPN